MVDRKVSILSDYIYSDPHFGHKNIIKYENRPFVDIEEMDRILIEKWNKVVKNEDKVFILGDFSFYDKEKTKEIINQLKGYKILIMGNHDRERSLSWWSEVGIHEVYQYSIIYNEFFILSHEPVYLNENMPYANIHGHTHHLKYESKQFFNASVECIDYTPVLFEEVKKAILLNFEDTK